jgi:hypothetical protein
MVKVPRSLGKKRPPTFAVRNLFVPIGFGHSVHNLR